MAWAMLAMGRAELGGTLEMEMLEDEEGRSRMGGWWSGATFLSRPDAKRPHHSTAQT
jgi:hypothetical protein